MLLVVCVLCGFLLVWCWDGGGGKNTLDIDVWGVTLNYVWNVELSKVNLKIDDIDEIVDLYQEVWDDVWYRDSLLIAKKYNQWLWINAFVQENLDVLEDHELVLSNINKEQIAPQINWKETNAVLVEYEIVEWFVEEIPRLYISQLFIPDWNMVLLMSFITENSSSRNNMSKAFKQIK